MTLRIYCDGASRGNPGPAAAGFLVKNEKSQIIFEQGFFLGKTTNNVAEYAAVFLALRWLLKNAPKVKKVNFYLDSQLVVNQLKGLYKIKSPALQKLALKIRALEIEFSSSIIYQAIPRQLNKLADRLVNQTLNKNC